MLHDHGNEGNEPVIWFDGLDSPVVRYLEVLSMQRHSEDRQEVGKVVGASERRFGAAGLRPASVRGGAGARRLIHYRWQEAYDALVQLAEVESDAFDDVMLEYVDPATGRSIFPTMACYLQMIRPGVHTRAHRQASSAVYHVVRGAGSTVMDGTRYAWGERDFFAIPPLVQHEHANDGREPAILFSLQIQSNQCNVIWSNTERPDDTFLIVTLLHNRCHDTPNTDTIATHEYWMRYTLGIKIGCIEQFTILRT